MVKLWRFWRKLVCHTSLLKSGAGDLITFLSAGAYGASMSNEYNSRPLIPEILVDNDKFEIIRRRPSYEEMVALEKVR